MKDLISHHPDFSLNDVHLLKMGRHFRLSPKVKLVVGRNEDENRKVETFSQGADILLWISNFPGPLSLLRGGLDRGAIEKAAAIMVRYSKAKDLEKIEVTFRVVDEDQRQSIFVLPASREEIERLIIQ